MCGVRPAHGVERSAGKSAQRARSSEQVAMCKATGQDDQNGSVREAARAMPCTTRREERATEHGTETTAGTWTHTESSGHLQTHQRCVRRKPRHGQQRRLKSSLEDGGGFRSCEDGRTGGRHHHQAEKRDQSKKRGATQTTPVGEQLDAAKTALTLAATLMSGSKSRSGEGNTADCVSGMSEMCIADPEPTTIHTNPERRGRRCENSARSGSCDRRSGMILRTRAHSPLTKKQDFSRHNKQLWRCGRGKTSENVPLPTEKQDEDMEIMQLKPTQPEAPVKRNSRHHARRGGNERNESTDRIRSVHTLRRDASIQKKKTWW